MSGVSKSYGGAVQALTSVDLEANPGEILAVLGRNGAGKSTLFSIAAGLLDPDSGEVRIAGVTARRGRRKRASLGFAPQKTGIYRSLTVEQNLQFFANLHGITGTDARRAINATAARLGITKLMGRRASTLSGGEARRLHVACSLVHAPQLVLLDEPSVGADIDARDELLESIRQLAAAGTTVLYATHYLAEVEALDCRTVFLHEGVVVASGTRSSLAREFGSLPIQIVHRGPVPTEVARTLRMAHIANDTYETLEDFELAEILRAFGAGADRVVSVSREEPSIETLFRQILGGPRRHVGPQ